MDKKYISDRYSLGALSCLYWFFILVVVFVSQNGFAQGLSGNYTIGAEDSDFKTFSEAASRLNTKGIAGSVVFKVKTGTYQEQFVLSNIAGVRAERTITFESASGHKEDVVVRFNSTELRKNYVVLLDSVQNVTFKNLSLRSESEMYGNVVTLEKNCNGINFLNNNFTGVLYSSYFTDAVLVSVKSQQRQDRIVFVNNVFYGGCFGLKLNGDYSSASEDNVVENNRFLYQYQTALTAQYLSHPVVRGNYVESHLKSDSRFTAMELSYCSKGAQLTQNNIIAAGTGLYVSYCLGTREHKVVVANNMVSDVGLGLDYGLQSYGAAHMVVYNNTFRLEDPYNGTALYLVNRNDSVETLVYNNIFSIKNNYRIFYIEHYGVLKSDYNNIVGIGVSPLFSYNGQGFKSFSEYQKYTGQDVHSLSEDPLYKSATDAHINKALLKGAGLALAEITTDVDGDLRPSRPSIGADEFTPQGANAMLQRQASPVLPFGAGQQALSVELRNVGAATLSSLKIQWEINGVAQRPITWTGSVPVGGTTVVKLDDYVFEPQRTYQLKAWTEAPNGEADIETANDTLKAQPFNTALSGAYSIGQTGSDFSRISDAVKQLNEGGVIGSVVFNIKGGTYHEHFIISDFPGNSCEHPVTFQSVANDTVIVEYGSSSDSNYIVLVDRAKGIDMRGLTLRPLYSNYGKAIHIVKGSSCINLSNNIFEGIPYGSSDAQALIALYSPYENSYDNSVKITIENNRFNKGSYGIYMPASSNMTKNIVDSGLVISHNQFVDQVYTAILVSGQIAPLVKENTIYNTSNNDYVNLISMRDIVSGGSVIGNKITSFRGNGISIGFSYSLEQPLLVANNMVSILGGSQPTGISLSMAAGIHVVHNNVFVNGGTNSSYAFYSSEVEGLKSLNNIFYNVKGYASYILNADRSTCQFDYNDYFSGGPFLTHLNGIDYSVFANMQKWSWADQHSYNIDPLYTSNADLHVGKGILNGAALKISEIVTDFDGQARDQFPDIGADEFTPQGADASLSALAAPLAPFASGEKSIKVVIYNSSSTVLNAAKISWSINGVALPDVAWTGSLNLKQADTVLLGKYTFNSGTHYDFKAWLQLPSGMTNIDTSDDSLNIQLSPALNGTYTIGGQAPNFASFSAAVKTLNIGGILGAVTFKARPGTYTEQLTINAFPGNACDIPVVFTSETNDSTSVVLKNTNVNPNDDYLLVINNVKGLVFRKLSFVSANTYYNNVIYLENGASCNTFTQNYISAVKNRGFNTIRYTNAVVLSYQKQEGLLDLKNQFVNNVISGGSYGIYLKKDTNSIQEQDIVIEKNKFSNHTYEAVYMEGFNGITIKDNSVTSPVLVESDGLVGIEIKYSKGPLAITGNRFKNLGYGIYITECGGGGKSSLIANNSIAGINGIHVAGVSNVSIYHNSVNTVSTRGWPFYLRSAANVKIHNNNFVHSAGGSTISIDMGTVTKLLSDYNNIFSTGPEISDQQSFASWKASSGQDQHSMSVDPEFVSAEDLHLTSSVLKRKGIVLNEVGTDIEGNPRNATAPDLGAYEYPDILIDLSITAFSAPVSPMVAGSNNIKVILYNKGLSTLNSTTIHWSVNNVAQPPFSWTGALKATEKIEVSIGSYVFVKDTRYDISAWSSKPNQLQDQVSANDSSAVRNLYVALAGSYTVGKGTSDFQSIAEAAKVLHIRGVSSPVTFNILKGNYVGGYTIRAYAGSSCANTVTFQPADTDSSSVVLSHTDADTSNYVFRLSRAQGLVVKGLTFSMLNTVNSTAITLEQGASCNLVMDNVFKGPSTASTTSTSVALVYSESGQTKGNHRNTFTNNFFEGGGYGLYLNSRYEMDSNVVINKNQFSGQIYYGINASYQLNTKISQNKVSYAGTRSSYAGIYMYQSYAFQVEGNRVDASAGMGFNINSCSDLENKVGVLYNNFASAKNYGIYLDNCENLKIYHNTMVIRPWENVGYACYGYYADQISLYNNIFANFSKGYACYLNNSTFVSDYNDLFTSGPVLVSHNYVDIADLAAWQTKKHDRNSFSLNPEFNSLQSPNLINAALNNKGVPIPEVLTDIDGDLRNINTPDIGADEYDLPRLDASISRFYTPKRPFPSGNQDISVVLRSLGVDTLTTATINWRLNDTLQLSYQWNGRLSGYDSVVVQIGKVDFKPGKAYSIQAWVSSPNGRGQDMIPKNDSCAMKNVYAALAGTYTIGETGADFSTINSAVAALVSGGVVGATTFNIHTGTYTEQVVLPAIASLSSQKSLTLQSSTGNAADVSIEYATNQSKNYVISLEGARHITLKNLTIKSLGTSYANVVDLRSNADSNTLSNNIIIVPPTTTFQSTDQTHVGIFSYVITANNDYNKFLNNKISGGTLGIMLVTGRVITSNDRGNHIENNIFSDQKLRGIDLQYQDFPVVVKNSIVASSNATGSYKGIYLLSCSGAMRIESNSTAVNPVGAVSGCEGIVLEKCLGTASSKGLLANNFVNMGTIACPSALRLESCSYLNVDHNTLTSKSTSLQSFALVKNQGTYLNFRNNILAHMGAGQAARYNPLSYIDTLNNNCYYAAKELLVSTSDKTAKDLTEWKSISYQDMNSVSTNPFFYGSDTYRLREVALKNKGARLIAVAKDIEGDLRDGTPDLGADEFAPENKTDAGLAAYVAPKPYLAGKHNIQILLRNYAADTLKKVTIAWTLNKVPQPAYTWSGTLPCAAEVTLTLSEITLYVGLGNSLKFWISGANGAQDTTHFNDTLTVDEVYPALKGTYTIGGIRPDFASFTDATFALHKGGVAESVVFNVRNGAYNEQLKFNAIKGATYYNTITFQSEAKDSSKVVLSYNSNVASANHTVLFEGCQFVTFKNMTLSASGSDYGTVVNITNGSDRITLQNNIIKGIDMLSSNFYFNLLSISNNSATEAIEISNNRFVKGNTAVYVIGQNTTTGSKRLYIRNNTLEHQRSYGISVSYATSCYVTGNKVLSGGVGTGYIAMYLYYCSKDVQVIGNHLDVKDGGTGMDFYSCSEVKIANNSISVVGENSYYGLSLRYGQNYDVVYNSVLLKGSNGASSRAVSSEYNSKVSLINNNIVNLAGGYAIYATNLMKISDHNNIYSNGSSVAYYTKNFSSITDWSTFTSLDRNSLALDPRFYSDSDLRFSNSALDSTGVWIDGITTDFNNRSRNRSYPDIGAFEFYNKDLDLGVSAVIAPVNTCETQNIVKLKIANYGTAAQSGFTVAYSIDGGETVIEKIDSLIGPGRFMDYTFTKQVNVDGVGSHKIIAYTMLANDKQSSNDSLVQIFSIYPIMEPSSVWELSPINDAKNLVSPLKFLWSSIAGATSYDLKVWTAADSVMLISKTFNAEVRTYEYYGNLAYGEAYKWQVGVKNACSQIKSPISTLHTNGFPDLVVEQVKGPASSFSGQRIDVSWNVENIGKGHTLDVTWGEHVYLSEDTILDFNIDIWITRVMNFSALGAEGKYSQVGSAIIPEGLSGKYYLIVLADRGNWLTEVSETNNISVSEVPIAISLTPPPDLRVTSVVTPENAFSGDIINFSVTVTNKGLGESIANAWYDRVLLSQDKVYTGRGVTLARYERSKKLYSDSSYTKSFAVKLPEGISGKYYLYVVTDEYDYVYEHVFEGNNVGKSDSINVILRPPADLVVTEIDVPRYVNGRDTIEIAWTVTNAGGNADESVQAWYDYVYLDSNINFVPAKDRMPLVRSRQTEMPLPGYSYKAKTQVVIPEHIGVPFYIHVFTDAEKNVFEYEKEGNNHKPSDTVLILKPDLRVVNLLAPSKGVSGDSIKLQWTVLNSGKGVLKTSLWTDKIYVSSSSLFDPTKAILFDSLFYKKALAAGDSVTLYKTVALPEGLSGTYYIYVSTDASASIYETSNTNNTAKSKPLTIELLPGPDLVVQDLSIPDSMQAGNAQLIRFTVKNKGLGQTRAEGWVDRIYVSTESVWSPANAILLKEITHMGKLAISGSYAVSALVQLPVSLKRSNYYIHVFVDGKNRVYEHAAEDNNLSTRLFYLKPYPPVDLMVAAGAVSGKPASGKSLNISWKVENRGEAPTAQSKWSDAIYLSLDTVLNETDLLLTTENHEGILNANGSYEVKQSVLLPNGKSGLYYFIVVADAQQNISDINIENNQKAIFDTAGNRPTSRKPFDISLTPAPDLVVKSIKAPERNIVGQEIPITYTVVNEGKGTTQKNMWTDAVYLSADSIWSKDDVLLTSGYRFGALESEKSYTQEFKVYVPLKYSFSYYLILKTDVTNQEFEDDREDNNTIFSKLFLALPPPSDLVVSNVVVPDTAVTGESVQVSWSIYNAGDHSASGLIKEAIYLSEDTLWSFTDILAGAYDMNINIEKKQTLRRTVTIDLPGLAPTKYHMLVRTDINNNIYEASDSNNLSHSMDQMKITVPQINIGASVERLLSRESKVYYKIVVPNDLKGESLLLSLKGDSINGANELYMSYEAVPNRAVHDFAHDAPFQGNQEIVIPELKAGTYYVQVIGNNRVSSRQQIQIKASILNFELRSVRSNKGGNVGRVTLLVMGSKFDPKISFSLINGRDTLRAENLRYKDATQAFVTFDLKGAPLGLYELMALNSKQEKASMYRAFEVVSGGHPHLVVWVQAPKNVRGRRLVPITIEYGNDGNTDISFPQVTINSRENAPLSFTAADVKSGVKSLKVPLHELNGPDGVLRPGAGGSITIFTESSRYLNFFLKAPKINFVTQ